MLVPMARNRITLPPSTSLVVTAALIGWLYVLAAGCGQSASARGRSASARHDDLRTLVVGWKLQVGDDPSWARPDHDDSDWQSVATSERLSGLGERNWFRLSLDIDERLGSKPQALYLDLMGSAQLFVNGELVANFGSLDQPQGSVLGFGSRFQRLSLPEGPQVTLAIRYRPHTLGSFAWLEPTTGFRLTVGSVDEVVELATTLARAKGAHQMMFVAAFTGQAILFFLLFLFVRAIRSNLWFALTSLSSAALVGVHFEGVISEQPEVLELSQQLWGPLLFLTMLLLLRFGYEVFNRPLGGAFWTLIAAGVISAVIVLFRPQLDAFSDFAWFHLLVLAETLRITIAVMRGGWRGAWIIGCGLGLLTLSLAWQLLLLLGIAQPPFQIFPIAYYGVAGLLLSVSTYLAYKIAQLGRVLREQLDQVEELSQKTLEQELQAKELDIERRLLEADNRRKTEELAEARDLQLSLLPAQLPDLPHLEIAVSMATATEVGGDYYDFRQAEAQGLLVAIGDATGHGARAGAIVSLMKGLFATFASGSDISGFFAEANAQIRSMSLSLQMSMAIGRLSENRFTYSSAGMPPALVFRGATGQVVEILVEGMPLGGLAGFRYREEHVSVSPGDTILLLSDGLPELPNREGTSLGYDEVTRLFRRAAGGSAHEIVASMNRAAHDWAGSADYPDDITLVVLKLASSVVSPLRGAPTAG